MAYHNSNETTNLYFTADKVSYYGMNRATESGKKQYSSDRKLSEDISDAVEIAVDLDDDSNLPNSFNKKRHTDTIEGINCISQSWRMKERMKTVSVALVLCLNVGVDPPDVVKIQPCARVESWIDPSSVSPQKALELIGSNLQKQYERWQPRARYKQSLDPTVEDIKKLCTSLRRNAKDERVLFHYNGHGVPRPTTNGEIWVFNRNYTQYIPLSVYDLQTWMGAPSIYVYDCSHAGIIVNSFNTFADQHERELEQIQINGHTSSNANIVNASLALNSTATGTMGNPSVPNNSNNLTTDPVKTTLNSNSPSQSLSIITYKNCIQLAACSSDQNLPMNPLLPADLFTACLTTPIKIALKWYTLQPTAKLLPHVSYDLIERIPGQLNDRRTMLGELNWIFTAITDTIAWNTLPRDLFQKLFRQDLLVASLFRNFLLAERILRSYDCTPVSSPSLPPCYRHPMWLAWDLALDLALTQLPDIVERGIPFDHSPFFKEQLTAFQVWLEGSREKRSPPEQLPIVLQVLLSQVHRLRALELLGRFLDLGPWAVNLALSVGIFPYVLKLLQSSAKDLRPCLIFIWAKILAVDSTCQIDLVRDNGLKYFLSAIQDQAYSTTSNSALRTFAAFVLSIVVHNFPTAQKQASQGSLVSICLVQMNDSNPMLRQWLAICLGNLWKNCNSIRWSGVRDLAHEKLYNLLQDPVPEVRAAACYALGTFISSVTNRSEHANNIDRPIAMTLLQTVGNDMSPIVRMELIAAVQWMIIIFENKFIDIYLDEQTSINSKNKFLTQQQNQQRKTGGASGGTTPLLSNNSNRKNPMIRVSSIGSLINLGGGTSSTSSSTHHISQLQTPMPAASASSSTVSFSNIYLKIWNAIDMLSRDPYEPVAHMAQKIMNYIHKQSNDHRISKKFLNYEKILTSSSGANINLNFNRNHCSGTESNAGVGANSNYYSLPPSPKTSTTTTTTTSAALAQLTSALTLDQHSQKQKDLKMNGAGGNAAGSNAAGSNAAGSNATGNNAAENNAAGSNATGNNAAENNAAGSNAAGNNAAGNNAAGSNAAGNNAAGSNAASSAAAGTGEDTNQESAEDEQPMKPIVQTNYLEWSTSFFARQSDAVFPNIREMQHKQDENSAEYMNRSLRFKLNKKIRDTAKYDQQQKHLSLNTNHIFINTSVGAPVNSLKVIEQMWIGRTKSVPQLVKLHPYSPKMLIAYNDKVLLHDYETNVLTNTFLPQKSASAGVNCVRSMDFINPHDMMTLVLVCYENGVIRIWQDNRVHTNSTSNDNRINSGAGDDFSVMSNDFSTPPASHDSSGGGDNDTNSANAQAFSSPLHNSSAAATSSNNIQSSSMINGSPYPFTNFSVSDDSLITAFNGINDVNMNKKSNNNTNAIAAWNQLTHTIAIGGSGKIIRLWDAETELKKCDIQTGTDSSLLTLKFSPNGLLVAGCDDGSVRLFDKRLPSNQARIKTYREHNASILTATLRDDAHTSLVTACKEGYIRLYDIRAQQSVFSFNVGPDLTTISVHRTANIVACATHFIGIYKMDGRQQSTIRYNEGFMTPRLGPTSCLSFHPYKINLAACFTDNNVSIFKTHNT